MRAPDGLPHWERLAGAVRTSELRRVDPHVQILRRSRHTVYGERVGPNHHEAALPVRRHARSVSSRRISSLCSAVVT